MVELPGQRDRCAAASSAAAGTRGAAQRPSPQMSAQQMCYNNKRILMSLAVLAALGFANGAQAQYVVQYSDGLGGYGYRAEPLYPYAPQPQIIYPQQSAPRAYPYVRSPQANVAVKPASTMVSKADPALIAELRKRGKK